MFQKFSMTSYGKNSSIIMCDSARKIGDHPKFKGSLVGAPPDSDSLREAIPYDSLRLTL